MSIFDRSPRGNIESPTGTVSVSLGTLAYTNPRLPTAFNGNAENALNYLVAHAFPNYIATVATPAALPVSASPNDYYIVSNDGDGKSAGYVWIIKDNAGSFVKRYDVDWSFEGIYSETINRTQYMYVQKYGLSDKNDAGTVITGTYAGQTIYGGAQTGENLTFNANAVDATGFIQTDNTFRPTANNTLDLGTTALKFQTGYFGTSVLAGTLTASSGSVTDSSGTIGFGNNTLESILLLEATSVNAVSSLIVGDTNVDTLTLTQGLIEDTSGTISFGDMALITTGEVTADGGAIFSVDIHITTGSIFSDSGALSFGTNDVSTSGALGAGITTVSQLNVDNLRLDASTLSATSLNGSIHLLANGTGIVSIDSPLETLGIAVVGDMTVSASLEVGNLRLDGNQILSLDTDGIIELSPNGSGSVRVTSSFMPSTDAVYDLGTDLLRFGDLNLSGAISDGTTSITNVTLQSLRDINSGVTTGMSLFWNGSKWVASAPDTEITHNTLSGLTTSDAGHTQFVMLAGRSGGQVVQGGTAASETLVLESTSHATKGLVLTKDVFAPFTNASFSGGWSGTDLGGSANYFKDVYTKGEFFGLRFQNVSSLPSNSAQNIGRPVFNTGDNKLYLDSGTSWVSAGSSLEKFSSDTSWDGSTTTKDVDVSATITDARTALWQLCDNANDFERIYTSIKATSATNVRITVSPALPAGSYRLIGIN